MGSSAHSARTRFDLVVVGNGAVGCALALRASETGRHVALLGPARRTSCATLAAGAMLSAFGEIDEDSLDGAMGRARIDAALRAASLWQPHLDLLNARLPTGGAVGIQRGTHVASFGPADDRSYDAIVAALRAHAEPFHEVDPHAITGISSRRAARAIYIEREAWLSARELLRAYDTAFARSPRVHVVDGEAGAIEPGGAVRTTGGETLHGEHVVLAAGLQSQTLLDQLGVSHEVPRVVAGVGVSIVVRSENPLPERVFRSPNRPGGGIYAVPQPGGLVYIGSTHRITNGDPRPRLGEVARLIETAVDQLSETLRDAEIVETIVGARPTSSDGSPLIGHLTIDRLSLATGTRRDGLHLSPLIADELLQSLETRAQPFGGAFVPQRA